jgi:hypothetical protein
MAAVKEASRIQIAAAGIRDLDFMVLSLDVPFTPH